MTFTSCYSSELEQYYLLRSETLSTSALSHGRCYLKRFGCFLDSHGQTKDSPITEDRITGWLLTLNGKSRGIEGEVVVIRQFLKFLSISGHDVYIPKIPKVRDDYEPYIFSDNELGRIFTSADNIVPRPPKTNPYIVLEMPVIIRLLFCCGLRIGETLRLTAGDVDPEKGTLRMVHAKGGRQRLVPMD